jgi:hypothetical protein
MLDLIDIYNIIAAAITICSAAISLILWFKYKERNQWTYSNYLSLLEGLTRIIKYSRMGNDEVTLNRVGDMAVDMRDIVIASLKAIDPKRSERLKSSDFGYRYDKDKLSDLKMLVGEFNPSVFRSDLLKNLDENYKINIVNSKHEDNDKKKNI